MSEVIAVSIRTAADMLDVSQDVIRSAVHKGDLRAKRLGRLIRIDVSDLRAWFASLTDTCEAAS